MAKKKSEPLVVDETTTMDDVYQTFTKDQKELVAKLVWDIYMRKTLNSSQLIVFDYMLKSAEQGLDFIDLRKPILQVP